MRYAIISDIHANLEALQAVLSEIDSIGADTIICLGDIVGYGADPNETIDLLRDRGIVSILGNHDSVACGFEEPTAFNALARMAMLWTRNTLTESNRTFLRELRREILIGPFFICHGTVHDTNQYLISGDDARLAFEALHAMEADPIVAFYGHTHMKAAFSFGRNGVMQEYSEELLIEHGARYVINPGSIGQPRDSDPRAAFLIYDTDKRTVQFHRVAYDIELTQKKIINAGLPHQLAERLTLGR